MVNQGLKNAARSPGSIVNAQHHDPTGSERNIDGSAAVIDSVVSNSSVLTPIQDLRLVRVVNTDAAVQYFWHGRIDQAPGTINAASSFALPPGHVENFHLGQSDDPMLSMAIRSSSSAVQVVLIKE